jgi:serine protease AprX
VRGIGSLSGVPLDPLSVTNGIGGIGKASVHETQFLKGEEIGLDDVAGHPLAAFIRAAVAARLADGRATGRFAPNAALTRIEMAEYLVSGFGVRQQRPLDGRRLFTDVSGRQLAFAESVSVPGALIHTLDVAAAPAMLGQHFLTKEFFPGQLVTRERAAYSLVQALGLGAEADNFQGDLVYTAGTGQQVVIADQGDVAVELRGYVQRALDLGLIEPQLFVSGQTTTARFRPARPLLRGQWALAAVRASTFQQSRATTE